MSLAVALVVATVLAGCGNPAKPQLVAGPPTDGYDAAFAQALDVAPAPRLVRVDGLERASNQPGPFPIDEFYNQADDLPDSAVGDGQANVWMWEFQAAGTGIQVLTSGNRVIAHRQLEAKPIADFDFSLVLSPTDLVLKMDAQFPGWKGDARGVRWTLSLPDGEPVDPYWVVDSVIQGGVVMAVWNGVTGDLILDLVPASIAPPKLVLSDCTNFGGVFPVPVANARAALPAGFEPVISPNDPAGGATLYVLFLECNGSSVDGNDTGAVKVAYAELAVVPPTEFTLPGISDYTVPLAIGANVDAVGNQLARFLLGNAGISSVTDTTTAEPGPRQARMVVDGVTLDLTGQMSPGAGTSLGSGGFALIGVQDGAVRSIVQATSQGGTAVQGPVAQQSSGLPIFAQARPAAVGFSVSGFTLDFALAKTFEAATSG